MIEIVRPILKKIKDEFSSNKIYFDTGLSLDEGHLMSYGDGKKYEVYTDFEEEGVNLPAFFVKIIKTDLVPRLGRFYFLNNIISITYISDASDMLKLEDMRLRMLFALKDIKSFGGLGTEGKNLSAVIEDNCVIMTGDYNLEVEVVPEKIPYMRILGLDYFSDDKISLNDINKTFKPKLYQEDKKRGVNTVDDLRKKNTQGGGVDKSIIDLIDKEEKNDAGLGMMRRLKKWNTTI